jgi:DNA repair ATPase RecN
VIGQITEDNYPVTKQQIDNLVEQYLQNNMQRPDFQQRFEDIITHQPPHDMTPPSSWTGDWQQLPELMATQRLHQISSNVGMKVELFRAHRELVDQIRAIAVTTGRTQAAERTERIRELVRDYYETYDQVPRFLQELGIDISHEHALQRLKNHHQALSQIAGQTLDLRVQLLANGHEAYAIRDEEDRPLARRIGEFLDNPWVGAGTFSLPVVSSLIFGWPA